MYPHLIQDVAAERAADYRREAAAYRDAETADGNGRAARRHPTIARPRPLRLNTVLRDRQASDQARLRLAARRATAHAQLHASDAELNGSRAEPNGSEPEQHGSQAELCGASSRADG